MFSSSRGPEIRTVSEINRHLQNLLDHHFYFVRVVGEISGIRRPLSGHTYFSLKDEKAQLRGVLFKTQRRYLERDLADGDEVICEGRLTVYAPRGEYQLVVDTISFQGTGQLQLAFARLKKKLMAEGLFESIRKKPLPEIINRIALITSPTGAAIHDFLSVCRSRRSNLRLSVLPVRVQGEGAHLEISEAVERAAALAPDVIVLCRGGGSIEDLWSFNEESVARAISRAEIPVVTGIGHETDVTIADFCADLRCATPTAAAERLAPETSRRFEAVMMLKRRLGRACNWRLDAAQTVLERAGRLFSGFDTAFYDKTLKLDALQARLVHLFATILTRNDNHLSVLQNRLAAESPTLKLELFEHRRSALEQRLVRAIDLDLSRKRSKLQETAAILESVSPLATLARGYSIVTGYDSAGRSTVVCDAASLHRNQRLQIIFSAGRAECVVVDLTT